MVHEGFCKHAWAEMCVKLNSTFGSQYGRGLLKSRFKCLRRLFNHMKILPDHEGFSWDEMQQKINANDYTWNSFIKVPSKILVECMTEVWIFTIPPRKRL
ncbi:hypothetical protein Ancab_000762 [Ancistrocladus abbreviatus]